MEKQHKWTGMWIFTSRSPLNKLGSGYIRFFLKSINYHKMIRSWVVLPKFVAEVWFRSGCVIKETPSHALSVISCQNPREKGEETGGLVRHQRVTSAPSSRSGPSPQGPALRGRQCSTQIQIFPRRLRSSSWVRYRSACSTSDITFTHTFIPIGWP